jgi:hypothetical protein
VLTPLTSRIAAAWLPAFVGGIGILSTTDRLLSLLLLRRPAAGDA